MEKACKLPKKIINSQQPTTPYVSYETNCPSNIATENRTERKFSVVINLKQAVVSKLVTYLQAHLLVIKNPLLCCEPKCAGIADVCLASSTSIAVVTVAVEGQDSTRAELLRRAAGPRHCRTYSRKACHQAA